jgi:hypothetical protein
MIVYEAADVVWDPLLVGNAPPGSSWQRRDSTAHTTNATFCQHAEAPAEARLAATMQRRAAPVVGMDTCIMSLVGDYKYYLRHGSNAASAAATILQMIQTVDDHFRATDFALGQYFGVSAGEILIYTSAAADRLYSPSARSVGTLLTEFGRDLTHRNFCLAHLFTSEEYSGGVLGLAFLDTICDGYGVVRGSSLYYNSGLNTDQYAGATIPSLSLCPECHIESIVFLFNVSIGSAIARRDARNRPQLWGPARRLDGRCVMFSQRSVGVASANNTQPVPHSNC